MAELVTADGPEIVKWYTRARKFPKLIGRTPDGTVIAGGPYTITQAVGVGAVLLIGINTMGLWGRFDLITNSVILLGAVFGTIFLLGKIPVGARNPVAVATGAARASTSPRRGRVAGKPIRVRRPRRVQHHVLIALPTPNQQAREERLPSVSEPQELDVPHPEEPWILPTDPESSPGSAQPVATASAPPRRPALTGVQSLLASHNFDGTGQYR